jgi:hypothetical protein
VTAEDLKLRRAARQAYPLRSGPRHGFHCRRRAKFKVRPEPVDIRWIHDAFGNCVTFVDFNSSCQILEFETIIRLDHSPGNAPDFRIEDYARFHPFSYAEEEVPDLAAYIRRHHTEDVEVEAWLGKFLSKCVSQPTGQLLMTLNEAIAESFSYRRRGAQGTQTPSETIRSQNGSCRDLALLMNGFVVDLSGNVFRFIDDSIDGRAIDPFGLFANLLEHLLQPLHMIFGLRQVLLEPRLSPASVAFSTISGRDLTIFFSA